MRAYDREHVKTLIKLLFCLCTFSIATMQCCLCVCVCVGGVSGPPINFDVKGQMAWSRALYHLMSSKDTLNQSTCLDVQ